jgi:hypothetical protein
MKTFWRILTFSLIVSHLCFAVTKPKAWGYVTKFTGGDIKGFFEMGALHTKLNSSPILFQRLTNAGLIAPGEKASDVVARILFDRVAPKIIDEFGEISSEAHELAWRNVHLFVASLSHRNGGEALADLIEELGEEGAGDFMGKVFKAIGRTEGDAGAMDAIYFGNMMAYGKKQNLFSGYGANPGKYTADLLLDRLLDVTSVNPRFISSGNRVAKSERRGVRVGLIGLMSNTKDASARGFRLELDGAWTLKNRKDENWVLEKMGWVVKQGDGTTDMDIVASLQGRLYAIQVKASGSEFTTKSLGRWANLACKHVDKTIANPTVDDILSNVKFMFPPGPGDRVNDVATALIKAPPFSRSTIPQIKQLLVQKGCLIEIDVPSL